MLHNELINRKFWLNNTEKWIRATFFGGICLICSVIYSSVTYAAYEEEIASYLGYFLCETETLEEYGNPEVFLLEFDGEGQLT